MYSILLVQSGPDDSTEGGHLLTCGVIDPSRLFWCEMHSFGDVSCRDELHGA